MARVRFKQDYDYKPTAQSTIAYKADWEGTVRRECAEEAVAAGKAEWAGKEAEARRNGENQISG